MNINIKPQEELKIDGRIYVVQPDPDPDMAHRPYIELGGSGLVMQLLLANDKTYHALKIFNNPKTALVKSNQSLEKNNVSQLPGLIVAQREVINSKANLYSDLLKKYPFLNYAVLMPWIGGYTWFEILGDSKGESKIPAFNKNTSLYYASQLSRVLASLESKEYAHCDICSNNIILDFKNSSVQLIDIEDMYLPGASKSEDFIGGQNGYAHPNRPLGHQWVKESDRFGGGMLISEILTWCDPKIREASDSESFATPTELCKDSKKHNLMMNALKQYGNDELAILFDKLWNSKDLKSCPALREWDRQVRAVANRNVAKPVLDSLSQLGPDGRIRIQRKRISVSGQSEPRPTGSVNRRKVDVSVRQKTPSTTRSTTVLPKSLPIFKAKTDWGKIALWGVLIILAITACVVALTTGGYLLGGNSPSPVNEFSTEHIAPLVAINPSKTPRPPTAVPFLRPTNEPAKLPTKTPTKATSKSLLVCLYENAPARQGPGKKYAITDWAQRDYCYRFDGRYPASFNYASEVWLRIQADQDGYVFLGHSWVRADKLIISISEIKSLQVVTP